MLGHKITIPEVVNSLSVLKMGSVGCDWERCKIPQMCLIIPNSTPKGNIFLTLSVDQFML